MKLYELEMLRSRIYHGEQELISTLTPEQFFALLSHDYDTGFAAGKEIPFPAAVNLSLQKAGGEQFSFVLSMLRQWLQFSFVQVTGQLSAVQSSG